MIEQWFLEFFGAGLGTAIMVLIGSVIGLWVCGISVYLGMKAIGDL